MKIKQITKEFEKDLDNLIYEVEKGISDNSQWLPITKEAKDKFFDSTSMFWLGIFEDKKLVGASALFLNNEEYKNLIDLSNLNGLAVTKIGRCMIHPEYRKKGLIQILNKHLIEKAKKQGNDYIISIVHPEVLKVLKI